MRHGVAAVATAYTQARVVREVHTALATRPSAALARGTGMTESALSRRMSGDTELALSDIVRWALALGTDVLAPLHGGAADLLPEAIRGRLGEWRPGMLRLPQITHHAQGAVRAIDTLADLVRHEVVQRRSHLLNGGALALLLAQSLSLVGASASSVRLLDAHPHLLAVGVSNPTLVRAIVPLSVHHATVDSATIEVIRAMLTPPSRRSDAWDAVVIASPLLREWTERVLEWNLEGSRVIGTEVLHRLGDETRTYASVSVSATTRSCADGWVVMWFQMTKPT